jgi:ATP-dependent Clp endopeptidase proteolytic subunit ClpP
MPKIIALSGDVGWEITAKKVREELAAAKGKDVEFHVNSPGGFVSEGIEIFNVIRGYKGHTTAVITGVAASMASYFILACNKVVAYDNTIYMIHNPWTLAIGDYNDMGKAFEMLKSMATLIAKEYAKKTGAIIDKMQDFMDAETYFFGDEMKSEGFIDEILDAPEDSENDGDKASALTIARAKISNCLDRMRGTEAANEDFNRAVAYMDGLSALMDTPVIATTKDGITTAAIDITKTPAGAGNKIQEVKQMSLKALLADPANASAKAEYDLALANARTEGEAFAKEEMKAVIAKVSPILASKDYPTAVKDYGVKAIVGEGALATFDALVVMEDQRIEAAAAAAAQDEEALETPPNGGGDDDDPVAKAKAEHKAKMARCGVATTEGGK